MRRLHSYQDDDPTTGVIASIKDDLRGGETIVGIEPDLENRVGETVPEGNNDLKQTVVYDRLTGTTTSTDQLGRVSKTTRDDKLRLERVERTAKLKTGVEATYFTRNVYNDTDNNELDGPADVYDVRGNKSSYTYDEYGRVTSVTDALLRQTTIEYGVDAADKLPVIVITDAKTRKSLRKFDQQGRVKEIYRRVDINSVTPDPDTPPENPTMMYAFSVTTGYEAYTQTIEYNALTGGVDSVSNTASALNANYPWITVDETISVVERNDFGQVKKLESAAGYQTEYGYDGLARKRSVQGPADVAPVQLAYYETGVKQDAVSQIITPVGTITKDYDVVNRQSSSTDARGVTTSKFYNRKNQLIRVVEVSPDSDSVLTTRYFYDAFGKLDYKLLPNGTQVDYEYDGFDRIVAMQERDGADVTASPVTPNVSTQPPALGSADANTLYSFDIDASTSVVGGLKYHLVTAPAGMEIDATTGVINWTPSTSQNSDTPYKVVIQVVGSDAGIADIQFDLMVGGTLANSDADNVPDQIDNCTNVANADQRDTDNDGFGNACDADLNNDGIVNFADMAILKSRYGSNDVDADFDGNGTVGVEDLNALKQQFGGVPGPSAVAQ